MFFIERVAKLVGGKAPAVSMLLGPGHGGSCLCVGLLQGEVVWKEGKGD